MYCTAATLSCSTQSAHNTLAASCVTACLINVGMVLVCLQAFVGPQPQGSSSCNSCWQDTPRDRQQQRTAAQHNKLAHQKHVQLKKLQRGAAMVKSHQSSSCISECIYYTQYVAEASASLNGSSAGSLVSPVGGIVQHVAPVQLAWCMQCAV
jgi:hypothetical protein